MGKKKQLKERAANKTEEKGTNYLKPHYHFHQQYQLILIKTYRS